jgi:predicted nuclease of predicted toxin-antitoxin system
MIRLLIDEDVHGDIVEGLRRRLPTVDLLRVQDVGLSNTPDRDILQWAASEERIVVSVDKKTLPVDAWNRVALGLPMPGVAILRTVLSIGQAIRELELMAAIGCAEDFRNLWSICLSNPCPTPPSAPV